MGALAVMPPADVPLRYRRAGNEFPRPLASIFSGVGLGQERGCVARWDTGMREKGHVPSIPLPQVEANQGQSGLSTLTTDGALGGYSLAAPLTVR